MYHRRTTLEAFYHRGTTLEAFYDWGTTLEAFHVRGTTLEAFYDRDYHFWGQIISDRWGVSCEDLTRIVLLLRFFFWLVVADPGHGIFLRRGLRQAPTNCLLKPSFLGGSMYRVTRVRPPKENCCRCRGLTVAYAVGATTPSVDEPCAYAGQIDHDLRSSSSSPPDFTICCAGIVCQ